jgi:hypothetical protein
MINVSSAATNPNDFFRVNSGNGFNTTFRVFIKTVTSNTFTIGISKGAQGNATVYTSNTYAFNQDLLLVFKYSQLVGIADDQLNLYVNPVISNGIPTTPDATTTSGTDQSGNIDRLVFRQNTTANTTPSGRVGLVSVAGSWTGLVLNTTHFLKEQFKIVTTNAKNGILLINSPENIEQATLSIYNIEGKLVENKSITLQNSINEIKIHPIANGGVYLVSISINGENYNHKVIIN